jgi:hypothetical protein
MKTLSQLSLSASSGSRPAWKLYEAAVLNPEEQAKAELPG